MKKHERKPGLEYTTEAPQTLNAIRLTYLPMANIGYFEIPADTIARGKVLLFRPPRVEDRTDQNPHGPCECSSVAVP